MTITKPLLQTKKSIAQHVLAEKPFTAKAKGFAFAPVNFALIKYWGKRNEILHLPMTDSLSLSIDQLGTHTSIREIDSTHDVIIVNGQTKSLSTVFSTKLIDYLDLFRPQGVFYEVNTKSDVAIASGLASSAAGFAALIKALNDLYRWRLAPKALSILARLGSGSACRSIYHGFVLWQKGTQDDGMDSYAVPLNIHWPELAIGLLITSKKAKITSSREAMACTVRTSPLYQQWPQKVAKDLAQLHESLLQQDFTHFGQIIEDNAIFMHKTSMLAMPSINYDNEATTMYKQSIQRLRQEINLKAYFTQDAGPNLKLVYLKQDESIIRHYFPEIVVLS